MTARMIEVGGAFYPEGALTDAMGDVLLERLEGKLEGAASARGAMRAIRNLRTRDEHQVVLREALRRVRAGVGADVCPAESVVARFPMG